MSEREMVQSVGLNYSVQAHWWRPKAAANGPGPPKSLRSPSISPTLVTLRSHPLSQKAGPCFFPYRLTRFNPSPLEFPSRRDRLQRGAPSA